MDFKIVKIRVNWNAEVQALYPNVLLYRDQNQSGENIVVIRVYGHDTDSEDKNDTYECVQFESEDAAKDFIRDFGNQSAIAFCERVQIITAPNAVYAKG